MLNGSLAMSVTFQNFVSKPLTSYRQQFASSGSPRLSAMHYSLFGNVYYTKTYQSILNISLSISIVHQLLDILNFSVYHFHYIMQGKKIIE